MSTLIAKGHYVRCYHCNKAVLRANHDICSGDLISHTQWEDLIGTGLVAGDKIACKEVVAYIKKGA